MLAGRADSADDAAPYLGVWRGDRGGHQQTNRVGAGRDPTRGGSPNVIGAIAIAAACAAFDTHRDAIEAHEKALAEQLRTGLEAIDSVTTYSIFGPEHDRVAVATFTIDGLDSSLVSTVLSAEYGIGVRDGKFCAHQLVDDLLDDPCSDDSPETAVRVSIGLANNPSTSRGCSARSPPWPTKVPRVPAHLAGLGAHQRPARPHPPRPW